jgi:hypothetical protein
MGLFQKYTITQGKMWQLIIEGGTDPKTEKRKQIKRRGFSIKKEAQIVTVDQCILNSHMDYSSTILYIFVAAQKYNYNL